MDNLTKFLLHHPNFGQTSVDKPNFVGNMKIKGYFYHVNLTLPEFPLIRNFRYNIYKGLESYSLRIEDINENWEINEFLENLPNLIPLSINRENDIDKDVLATKQFMQQLLSIKKADCQVHINRFYNRIILTNFIEYPKHYLEIDVGDCFGVKVRNHSLPEGDDIGELFQPLSTIDAYLKQFKKLVDEFCDFYTNMIALDELCYVVEPVHVTTKHNWRIFKLTERVLIKLIVNPFTPSSVCVKFIGPTYEIEKYRTAYNEGVKYWDAESDICTNLLRIFGLVYFPLRNADNESETDRYCNICYTYRLDGRVPIVSCDNPCCDLIFHVLCLREWFNLNGKIAFSVTLGSCPSCKEKLSASFADLLEI